MAYTDTWNAAFEASPADGYNVSEGAKRIRDTRIGVRERLAKDHYFDIAGTDADHGEHSKVTLRVGSAPTHAANKGILYAKDVSAKAELHYIDENGNEVQLTSGGVIAGFPAGTYMLFYQDTAPMGWTIQNTLDDKLVYITKGSAASGQTGGGVHSTGTWSLGAHTHTIAHTHTVTIPINGYGGDPTGGYYPGYIQTDNPGNVYHATTSPAPTSSASSSANSGSTDLSNTWRPAAYCCIIAKKD